MALAAVVAGAVGHVVEGGGVLPHALEDGAQDVRVAALPVGADQVGLADAAPLEDRPHGRGVVVDVDPRIGSPKPSRPVP